MHRKLTVILVAVFALVAIAGTMAIAADAPGQIVIDKVMKKKPGVAFDHAKHSADNECVVCHHGIADKSEAKSCFECHGKDPKAPNFDKVKTNPFHVTCKGCHKEKGEGPTKCGECHPK